jgi:pseudaminic acid cytidylyltransferase
MSNLAIIPARGGSKRIPKKNIKNFLGRPIISYSIETALESNLFDEVMVSTDDEEIANIALKYGAVVPFIRSQKNADDHASTADVIREVVKSYEKLNKHYDFSCCIYPTAPFISKFDLVESFSILKSKKCDTVFPICAYSYPIQRALQVNNSGNIEMIWPENMKKRSQDLQPSYHDAGQFYWVNIKPFLATDLLYSSNSAPFIIDEMRVQDIDNESDWEVAELKFKFIQKSNAEKYI